MGKGQKKIEKESDSTIDEECKDQLDNKDENKGEKKQTNRGRPPKVDNKIELNARQLTEFLIQDNLACILQNYKAKYMINYDKIDQTNVIDGKLNANFQKRVNRDNNCPYSLQDKQKVLEDEQNIFTNTQLKPEQKRVYLLVLYLKFHFGLFMPDQYLKQDLQNHRNILDKISGYVINNESLEQTKQQFSMDHNNEVEIEKFNLEFWYSLIEAIHQTKNKISCNILSYDQHKQLAQQQFGIIQSDSDSFNQNEQISEEQYSQNTTNI